MKKSVVCVFIGRSLLWQVDIVAAGVGRSRSATIVKLIDFALAAPSPPPLRHDTYLDDVGREAGRVAVYGPVLTWQLVDMRAKRFGETRSESVRALLVGGMSTVNEALTSPAIVEEKALLVLQEEPLCISDFSGKMWGDISISAMGYRPGRRAARALLTRLSERGLVEYDAETEKWRKK